MALKDILIKIATAFDSKGSKEAKQGVDEVLDATAKTPDTKGAKAVEKALKDVEQQAKETKQEVKSAVSGEGWGMSMKGQDVAPLPGSNRYKQIAQDAKQATAALKELDVQASKTSAGGSLFGGNKSAALESHDTELLAEATKRLADRNKELSEAAAKAATQQKSLTEAVAAFKSKDPKELFTAANNAAKAFEVNLGSVAARAGALAVVAATAKGVAHELVGIHEALAKVDPEAAKQFEWIYEIANSIDHPLNSLKEGFGALADEVGKKWWEVRNFVTGGVLGTIDKMQRAAEESQRLATGLEKSKEARRQQVAAFERGKIEATLKFETDQAKQLNDELARTKLIRDSEERVNQSSRQLDQQRASQAGASPESIQIGEILAQFAEELRAEQEKVRDAAGQLKVAQEQEAAMRHHLLSLQANGKTSEEDLKKAAADVSAAAAVTDKTAKDLTATEKAFENAKTAIANEQTAALEKLKSEINAKSNESLQSITEQIKADVESGKVELNSNAKEALKNLTTYAKDKIPDDQQTKEIRDALTALVEGSKKKDEAFLQGVNKLKDNNEMMWREIQSIKLYLSQQ